MRSAARCTALVFVAVIGLGRMARAQEPELTPEQHEALARLREAAAAREAGEEPEPADQTLSPDQMEKIKQLQAEAEARRQATTAPELQAGDILVAGRVGVNQLVNGVFRKQVAIIHDRPTYHKLKASDNGPEAVDLAVWWSSGKWYVGLLTEIGTDAAYAFVPSQAGFPDMANAIWSIWDGSKWLADSHIKCSGSGPESLHVGDPHQAVEDDDYDAYMLEREAHEREEQEREEKRDIIEDRLAHGEKINDDYYQEEFQARKQEQAAKNPEGGDVHPEAVPATVPRKIKFFSSCPEGHTGCSAYNLCRTCPAECLTCQNVRETGADHSCSATDCFECEAGYKHSPKHSDGRGTCVATSSGFMPYYILGGVSVVGLIIAAVFICRDEKQPVRKRGLLPSFS